IDGFTITHGGNDLGRGIHCIDSSPTVRNNIICNNISFLAGENHGSGVYLENSDALVDNNLVERQYLFNTYSQGHGCGLACNGTGSPVISNNIFRENHLNSSPLDYWPSSGAGIAALGESSPLIVNNLFEDNLTDFYATSGGNKSYGGAIFCEGTGNVLIVNNIIRNNRIKISGDSSGYVYGGGIAVKNEKVKIISNVIYGNVASIMYGSGAARGGGVYFNEDAVMVNTILWNNTATTSGNQIQADYCNPRIQNCCVQDGWPGPFIITQDPLFVDPEAGDFHIRYDSPCRDAGNSALFDSTDFDFEGDPRVYLDDVDIGADEFHAHLYYTGEAAPGELIEGKLIGLPGAGPVGLLFGSSVKAEPWHHQWGDFWLEDPWFLVPLIPMPADGVLVMPTTIPLDPPVPWELPMQGLVGLDSGSFTNLCVLEVDGAVSPEN
ncbi:MAG: right-handed parallel beta-helix repeat-containing protein, partial [Planctomycetes bacterium]|nr:right-handed parallel beta-helix repeat-containing protein [Planctomycetota bacterium]